MLSTAPAESVVCSWISGKPAEGRGLVAGLLPLWPTIRIISADADQGSHELETAIQRHDGGRLVIVKRSEPAFKIVGLNGIVERSFGRHRRLSRDCEFKVQTFEALIKIAGIQTTLNRLALA